MPWQRSHGAFRPPGSPPGRTRRYSMKKKLIPVLFALALAPCVAHAVGVGVGVFGGVGVPVLQDDNGQGTVFGVRVPVNLVPLVTVEPYFSKGSGGDKDQDVGGLSLTRSGIDAT